MQNAKCIARQVFVFVGKILNSQSSKIATLSSCGYIATRSTRYVLQWGCREPNPVALVTAKLTQCFEWVKADSTVQLWWMQCTYNNAMTRVV